MTRSLRFVVVIALGVAGRAAVADAAPSRIALAPITGGDRELAATIGQALDGDDLALVPARKVERALEQLKLGPELGERELGKLVRSLAVDAVVQPVVEHAGKAVRFLIVSDGDAPRSFTVVIGDGSPARFGRLVHSRLVAKLASSVPGRKPATDVADDEPVSKPVASLDKPGKAARRKPEAVAARDRKPGKRKLAEADDDDDDEPVITQGKPGAHKPEAVATAEPVSKPAKRKPAAEDEAVEPASKPAKRKPAAAEDEAAEPASKPAKRKPAAEDEADVVARAGGDDAEPTARVEPPRPTPAGANLAAARADVGVSMTGRSLSFVSTPGMVNPPKPYQNTPVPGARVHAELYPFALAAADSPLAGLGIAGDFDETIALTLRASAEMTVPLTATQRSYAIGVRYRYAFGHAATSPTLTAGVGYAEHSFVVSRSGLMSQDALDLPDVDYVAIDPGLTFRLPLTERFAVSLGGRALILTGSGAITSKELYGQASAFGASATAGLDVVLTRRIAFQLALDGSQIALAFKGNGTLATSRDGNSATVDVRYASDRYYGGAATLAVMY